MHAYETWVCKWGILGSRGNMIMVQDATFLKNFSLAISHSQNDSSNEIVNFSKGARQIRSIQAKFPDEWAVDPLEKANHDDL